MLIMNSEIHNLNELFEKDVIDTNNNIDELLSEDLIYKYKKELYYNIDSLLPPSTNLGREQTYINHLKNNPQLYIKYMMNLSNINNSKAYKNFNIFPTQNNQIKFIHITYKSLYMLYISKFDTNKTKIKQENLWDELTNHQNYKKKNYISWKSFKTNGEYISLTYRKISKDKIQNIDRDNESSNDECVNDENNQEEEDIGYIIYLHTL